MALQQLCHASDIARIGSAASAKDSHAVLNHPSGSLSVFVRIDVEDRMPVLDMRETCVGLHDDGLFGDGEHAARQRAKLGGTLGAIDAERVDPQRIERDGGNFGRCAQKRAAVGFEGHGRDDRQVAVLTAGEDRGFDLGQVGHGFDDEQVGPCCLGRSGLLCK